MLEYIYLLSGLILLVKGADWLIDGASALAKKLGISSLIIGLTIVAFGTSMPELFVNIFASLGNNGAISYGNIIGSNISNLLLILGLSAIILSTQIHASTVWREIPYSLLAAIILLVMSNDFIFSGNENILSMVDGIILLALFILFLYYIYRMIKKDQAYAQKYGADKYGADVRKLSSFKIYAWVLLGIAALYFGGELTVNTAVIIAKNLGVSDFLISITIIAVGTSLPELFTTIVAVTRKEVDIGVGTLVGSNIFNIFLILGVTALINPVAVPSSANLHILILIAITVLLFAFMFIGERHILKKWQGRTMVLLYLVYIYLIITGVLPA